MTTTGMFSQRSFGRSRPAPGRLRTGRHGLGLVAAAATLLATAPLVPLLDGWRWLLHVTLAVAAVAAAAAGARALRAPVWAQLPAMLAALLLMLTWLHPSGNEVLGLLPGPATLEHLGLVLGQLPADIQGNAIPVPDLASFRLVGALGIGVIAILVDLCAVGLRRPALAGLPMLVVYSVPVAVMFSSVPAYTFVIGVVGYLWLLGADNLDKVRRFGRRFTGDGQDVAVWEPSPLAAAGRRLGVVGLVVAVLVPLAVPGIGAGLVDRFGAGFRGIGGSGTGGTAVNLFAQLDGLLNRDQVIDMFEVTTSDPDPHYLRIGVADQITADGFDHRAPRGTYLGQVDFPLADPPGVTWHAHRTEVRVQPGFAMPRLPTYPQLTGIDGPAGPWSFDSEQQVVYAAQENSAGQAYEFWYSRAEFDPDALRQAPPLPPEHSLARLAEVPDQLREERVSTLVQQLTAEHDNPYDQVRAILGHFSTANGFRYSLETGNTTTGSAIVDFLFENRQGYCVQYAAAMTWMVRELGLPARVVIGFTSGRNRADGSFTLTNHNAHAWPEVYFEGFGWVPFEPTPRSSVDGVPDQEWTPDPNAPVDRDPNEPGDVPPGDAPDPGDSIDEDQLPADEFGGGGVAGPGEQDSAWSWWGWAMAGLVLLVVLLVAPALTRVWLRLLRLGRTRWGRRSGGGRQLAGAAAGAAPPAGPVETPPGVMAVVADDLAARQLAHAVWDELLDTMTDFRVPLDSAETPRMTASRLAQRWDVGGGRRATARPGLDSTARPGLGSTARPGLDSTARPGLDSRAQQAVHLLGHAEERARYAPRPTAATGLPEAMRTVRQALAGGARPTVRMRALLLPPSTLLRWRQRVTDVTTAVATVLSRGTELLGRLSPRRLLART